MFPAAAAPRHDPTAASSSSGADLEPTVEKESRRKERDEAFAKLRELKERRAAGELPVPAGPATSLGPEPVDRKFQIEGQTMPTSQGERMFTSFATWTPEPPGDTAEALLQECEEAAFRDPYFHVGGLDGTENQPSQPAPKNNWFAEVLYDGDPSCQIGDFDHLSDDARKAAGLQVPKYPHVHRSVKNIAIALRHKICFGKC
jgi:hypothetical protein